jgi:hypothetical protein
LLTPDFRVLLAFHFFDTTPAIMVGIFVAG